MNLNLKIVVTAAGLCLAAGIVAVAGVGAQTLQTLKVNGPIYKEIVDGKDLIADILPPPLYLIESYALANEVFTPSDAAVADARAILAAMEEAKANGQGATTYKGKLIDIASMKQAEVIVKQYELIMGA